MEKPKTRVLLAEDDENLGLLLKEYLNAKGYETDLFKDGDKAYKGFNTNHYDICILDVMMPIKDGFTLAKEIRTINNNMPILFLTAKSMKEDVLEGFTLSTSVWRLSTRSPVRAMMSGCASCIRASRFSLSWPNTALCRSDTWAILKPLKIPGSRALFTV